MLLGFAVGPTEAKNQKGKRWLSLKRIREKVVLVWQQQHIFPKDKNVNIALHFEVKQT